MKKSPVALRAEAADNSQIEKGLRKRLEIPDTCPCCHLYAVDIRSTRVVPPHDDSKYFTESNKETYNLFWVHHAKYACGNGASQGNPEYDGTEQAVEFTGNCKNAYSLAIELAKQSV